MVHVRVCPCRHVQAQGNGASVQVNFRLVGTVRASALVPVCLLHLVEILVYQFLVPDTKPINAILAAGRVWLARSGVCCHDMFQVVVGPDSRASSIPEALSNSFRHMASGTSNIYLPYFHNIFLLRQIENRGALVT